MGWDAPQVFAQVDCATNDPRLIPSKIIVSFRTLTSAVEARFSNPDKQTNKQTNLPSYCSGFFSRLQQNLHKIYSFHLEKI